MLMKKNVSIYKFITVGTKRIFLPDMVPELASVSLIQKPCGSESMREHLHEPACYRLPASPSRPALATTGQSTSSACLVQKYSCDRTIFPSASVKTMQY